MLILLLVNLILHSSKAINETDTRKYCFLPAASTVPRTVLTTTNALSLKGCYVPCALNANCQACSYNASTKKCTLLGPLAPANSCSEPYTIYEKRTTGCTDFPLADSNTSYTLSKCCNASDVIGPPALRRVTPVCGNATGFLRRVAYDTILHDGTRWVLENHRESFIDWDEKLGSWYYSNGVAVYYFYMATCVKVPAVQTCGCAALSTELPMAGYTTTGAAVEMEQAPPLCNGGQVQFRITRAAAPSNNQQVMSGAARSIYCAMGFTWMHMIDNGTWYNEWAVTAATCVAKIP
ncbi:hypothetical protein PRIPAC_82077 [Pristionchus pacificus]|uniref:Uncharacterized protein n=1 Tax=Pristionchus pacificus TaxID=54126 RepID=A0A2A6CKT8_PRIPA|nr:hypothetical protein PRIPAC_82077 [Pristionchus pacificus]|eukprot:PDM78708.1 hypothetical protein PRIPAC_31287 [Pristionchus pacificus]